MNVREPIYETKISDTRWWAYDIPGNAGWIAYLACLFHSLRRGLNTFNMAALLPGGLMLLGVGELISERIAGLDRVLPKRRLLRGFGALTMGGIGGIVVSALGLAAQKEKKNPAVMLIGSVLCAVFAGLCWQGYGKR
jgi:hypothetical protein